ncbi:MAG: TRIC cation channel family protein [Novosphingobium sp.]
MAPYLQVMDYLGIGVFAASGALLAAIKRLTFITFCFFAVATGVGGGTIRDLLIGAPVFWVHQDWPLMVCLGAALAVWFSPLSRRFGTVLLWLDAVGLAAYATYGAAKALAHGAALLPAFGLRVLTACAGGIIRDQLAHDRSILLRPELYVTAAAVSSGLLVAAVAAGLPIWGSALVATAAGFALRAAAITRRWALPAYKPGAPA